MLEITNIRNGAVLNRNHGRETDQFLEIDLHGLADPQALVKINGIPVSDRDDRRFSGSVRLTKKFNRIKVSADSQFGEISHLLTVVWDKKSFKRYNYYIDDCIFFYTDIAKSRPKSLFDHFFLKRLRKIHQQYKTRFTLNSFYRNDHFPFELKDFPDTYQQEWQDNADWLRLSFHAYSEFPNRPYQDSRPERLLADYDLLKNEIDRFAGKGVFISPVVIHWAMARQAVFAGLKARGVHYLNGIFSATDEHAFQVCDTGYFYEKDVTLYLENHKVFYDKFRDMFLGIGAGVCANMYPLDILKNRLADAMNSSYYNETLGMATHEQYSYDYYRNFMPDHLDRVEYCCRTASEAGYRPVFYAEGILGNTVWEDSEFPKPNKHLRNRPEVYA